MSNVILTDYFLNDGAKIFYRYDKKNSNLPVVVLLHGWVMNFTAMEMTREFFNSKEISTLNIDIRGHGHSASDSFSFDIINEDIRGILNKENIGEIVLFGYCMGGMIASEFVGKYPNFVKGIIFINTTHVNPILQFPYTNPRLIKYFLKNIYSITRDKEKRHYFIHSWINLFSEYLLSLRLLYKSFNFFVKNNFDHKTENSIVDFRKHTNKKDIFIHYEGLVSTDYRMVKKSYHSIMKMKLKNISKIDVPTLIITSKNDAICYSKTSKKIKKMISGSEIYILNDSDHLSILQENELINNLALDFFERKIKK